MHRPYSVRRICNSLLLTLVLLTSLPVLAQSRPYVPPRNGGQPTATGMGGTKSGSCTALASAPFTALAPVSHIGQTTATHPTVAVYVPPHLPDSPPLSIEFRLERRDASGQIPPQIVYRTQFTSQPGMMSLTLPQSEPALSIGQRYYWQAALLCDQYHPSEDLIVGADIQIVETSQPAVEQWYDLLQAASPVESTLLLQELAAIEQNSPDRAVREHGLNLKQVAETQP